MRKLLVDYSDYMFFDEKFMDDYFDNLGLDFSTNLKGRVKFVEIEMDDKNKTAFIIFKDSNLKPLNEKVEDDWYAIMDQNFV